MAWYDVSEYSKALADYDEAIRLDPQDAGAHLNRARLSSLCPEAKYRDLDIALESATKACELTEWKLPDSIATLALVYALKGDIDVAVKCQSRAAGLLTDQSQANDYRRRLNVYRELQSSEWSPHGGLNKPSMVYRSTLVLFLAHLDASVCEMTIGMHLQGERADLFSFYTKLLGYFAARRIGRDELAKKLLNDAAALCDTSDWPYPIVSYLRGEIDESRFLAAATNLNKQAQAEAYLGLDSLQTGLRRVAYEHFRRVRDHGSPAYSDYIIAGVEISDLEGALFSD
jgi:tetratricopeptide (TPR) repeat protein